MRFSSIFVVTGLCASSALGAQRAAANTDDFFTRIVGVRELRDGGVLVGDAGSKALVRVSPDLRTVRQIGEYRSVSALFPAAAGGATLFDFDGARLIGIDDNGRIVDTDTVPASGLGGRAQPIEILHMDVQRRACVATTITSSGSTERGRLRPVRR